MNVRVIYVCPACGAARTGTPGARRWPGCLAYSEHPSGAVEAMAPVRVADVDDVLAEVAMCRDAATSQGSANTLTFVLERLTARLR